MARILIIGGSGFIGSHLTRKCLESSNEIHVALRPTSNLYRVAGLLPRLHTHTVNLSQKDDVDRLLSAARPDLIYYLAAQTKHVIGNPFDDVFSSLSDDVLPLLNTLAVASSFSVKKVVRAASLAEYGNGPAPFIESQRERPLSAYAAGMTTATHYCQMMQSRLPFPVLHARIALTYGPLQSKAFLVPAAINNCLLGHDTVLKRPNDRRDLIHVDDVVSGLLAAGEANLPGGTVFNLATGFAPTMREVVNQIANLCDASPDLLIEAGEPDSAYVTKDLRAATQLVHSLLPWRAQTTLAEGLRRTVQAFRNSSQELG